ncbi:MAG: hypothetical protein ACLTYN_08290 [Dysosmobacter welbionis]
MEKERRYQERMKQHEKSSQDRTVGEGGDKLRVWAFSADKTYRQAISWKGIERMWTTSKPTKALEDGRPVLLRRVPRGQVRASERVQVLRGQAPSLRASA